MNNDERLKRWRLVLGEPAENMGIRLDADETRMDRALSALYESERKGSLGGSSPNVNRWLGDIRAYFPNSVVRVMQRDALERLDLRQMLTEPELLETIEADVHLVATLLSLRHVIPAKTRETARLVVRKVVDELEKKLRQSMIAAVRGSLNRALRSRRPRHREIDWDRTIRANLANYLPEKRTIIAERLIGHGCKRNALRDIVLCVDQSGSMAPSVVYGSIFAAVLASLRAVSTKLIVFDTSVADLTEKLADPVEVLFGTQLGGGTDINRALGYCAQQITRPSQTIMVLITDLCEGGDARSMLKRAAALVDSGVRVICLLALSDEGAPFHDERMAARISALGIPTFFCTPDLFPELMAAAIQKQDIGRWAASREIAVVRGEPER